MADKDAREDSISDITNFSLIRQRIEESAETIHYEVEYIDASGDASDESYKPECESVVKKAPRSQNIKPKKAHSSRDDVVHGKYVCMTKNVWAIPLDYMRFVFKGGTGTSKISSEESEKNINRYEGTINKRFKRIAMHKRAKSVKYDDEAFISQSSEDEMVITKDDDLYRELLRDMAIGHVLHCLAQGEVNRKFVRQQKSTGLYDADTSTSTCSTCTTEQEDVIEEHENEDKDEGDTPIPQSDVSWRVGGPMKFDRSKTGTYPAFSSPPIDPRHSPLLHPAILCLSPKYPSEPFVLFGISVYCAELEDIFSELCPGKSFNHVEVIPKATKFLVLLMTIHEEWLDKQPEAYTNRRKPVMVELLYSIRNMKENNEPLYKMWKEMAVDPIHRNLCATLENYSGYIKASKEEIYESETYLRNFISEILRLDGVAVCQVPQHIQQFQKYPMKTPTCIPDILYWAFDETVGFVVPLILELKNMALKLKMFTKFNTDEKITANFRPEFIWQVLEQLLAVLLSDDYELVTDKENVVQGGLMIVDSQVRSAVLHMRYDVYKKLKKFSNVRETLRFIKYNEKDWCSIYLEKSAHPVWHVLKRAKVTYCNFTENFN